MANITIKHAKIKFEKMDKNTMYVNATVAAQKRKLVDTNYKNIVNAWKEIENSFTRLAGKSEGKVQQLFSEAVTAAKKKKNQASARQTELDKQLAADVKKYAETILSTETLKKLIQKLEK